MELNRYFVRSSVGVLVSGDMSDLNGTLIYMSCDMMRFEVYFFLRFAFPWFLKTLITLWLSILSRVDERILGRSA